ncbi:hypothetical protein J4H86_20795 [Spiractinospora alimapuensis]|uniref:hypothetical protein n=1 Tax=Spiractinospora alimapuensis TaxID=2820884 RepID=UPI001F16DA1A|nr:hypothetical protein [Spiractinospora alimapuensis]QVQ51236.1 hypothetical protein J4H86_20795 [Spiractinospora alimapuensis]
MHTLTTRLGRRRFVAVAALGMVPAGFAVPVMVVLPRLLGAATGRPSPWPMIIAALPSGEAWLVVLGAGRGVYFAARIVNSLWIDGLLPRRTPGGAGPLTPWRLPADRRASTHVRLPHATHRFPATRLAATPHAAPPTCREPATTPRDERRTPIPAVPPPRRPLATLHAPPHRRPRPRVR